MKIKTEEAERKNINSIVKLSKQLADYHRKLDKYYKSGHEDERGFRKYLEKIIEKRNVKILIAKKGAKIIGYSIGIIENPKELKSYSDIVPKKIGKIFEIFVVTKYRRLGAGKQMFNELIRWFKKKRIKHVELFIDSRNKIGLDTFKKYSFFEFQKKMRMDL